MRAFVWAGILLVYGAGSAWGFGFGGSSQGGSVSSGTPAGLDGREEGRRGDAASALGIGSGAAPVPGGAVRDRLPPLGPATAPGAAPLQYRNPGVQQPALSQQPPRVEASLSASRRHVQQAVVYTVRVFSAGNLRTVRFALPKLPEFQVDTLVFGKTSEHWEGARKGYVTEYVYALTPLKAGQIRVPPGSVFGEFSDAGGAARHFEIAAGEALTIDVQPPEAGVNPWLVVDFLRTRVEFSKAEAIAVGEPVTLTITLEGEGVSAAQLPSIASSLKLEGAKVYQESSDLSTTLAPGQRMVTGKRVERFTVIPVQAGFFATDDIVVPWWHAGRQKPDRSILRFPALQVSAAAVQSEADVAPAPAVAAPAGGGAKLIGLLIIATLIAVPYATYWLLSITGWSVPVRRVGRNLYNALGLAGQQGNAPARPAVVLSPAYYARSALQRFVQWLPTPYKIWYCVRRLEIEDDPSDWCQLFQLYSTKYLDLPVNSPILQIADKLIEVNPRIREARMMQLVDEIEGCKYGGTPIEFESWKRRFREETRPPWLPWRRTRRESRNALPELNPRRLSNR